MSPLQVCIVVVRGLRINFETMVVLVILVIDIDTGDSISDMLVGGGVVWRRWWSVEMMVDMVVEMMVDMVVAMMVEMVVAMDREERRRRLLSVALAPRSGGSSQGWHKPPPLSAITNMDQVTCLILQTKNYCHCSVQA